MPHNKNFKTLSLPVPAYEGVLKAREEILRRGLGSIPKEILKSVDTTGAFTLGTIVDLAVAALLHATATSEKKTRGQGKR
jgi:hypothetical protein